MKFNNQLLLALKTESANPLLKDYLSDFLKNRISEMPLMKKWTQGHDKPSLMSLTDKWLDAEPYGCQGLVIVADHIRIHLDKDPVVWDGIYSWVEQCEHYLREKLKTF